MGVFAVFRRKKKDVVEASPEETGAVVASQDDEVTEAKSKAGTETETTEAAEIRAGIDADAHADTDVEEDVDGGAGAGVDADARVDVDVDADADLDVADKAEGASDVVEIPKQQSAEAAADNEAGEGARK
ncbi:hypothetical protein OG357_10000 [Streptomyces sp. NBC_01255]|uniref:hypothetical protein n=1 Tax=Streptomyces sp. NBC_01255 TaxID=2903798 RepID=UPI002E37731E|nr:hypothetical protein [Streptomyces sp. NBC_01255]